MGIHYIIFAINVVWSFHFTWKMSGIQFEQKYSDVSGSKHSHTLSQNTGKNHKIFFVENHTMEIAGLQYETEKKQAIYIEPPMLLFPSFH